MVVRVRACAINFPDVLIIEDKYQFKPPRPFAPGHEIAGDITEVGEGAGSYKVGDRVIGTFHVASKKVKNVGVQILRKLPARTSLISRASRTGSNRGAAFQS